MNAYAERFRVCQSECLDRIVPLGEKHLRAAVGAFMDHYHEERPHQGLGNERVAPKTTSLGRAQSAVNGSAACSGSITARPRNPWAKFSPQDGKHGARLTSGNVEGGLLLQIVLPVGVEVGHAAFTADGASLDHGLEMVSKPRKGRS